MWEEDKIKAGVLFCPIEKKLKQLKQKPHNLNVDYNKTYENETEKRADILSEMLGELGEGSVVMKDIPPDSFAAGVPCRVIRKITQGDSMKYKPEILADNMVIEACK